MRAFRTREAAVDSMAEKTELQLDRPQVKKAVQALQAFLKTKSTGESLFMDETQQISLLFTFWKVPKQAQTIRIPLPHGQRVDTEEVCLFTRDEPKMSPDQTQRFYKRLLEEQGVKNISEIIPYKLLKTEYKPFEAKRRLLGNFDLFLSDSRIRRLLPSHLGKHFYERKKEPLSVDLQSKHLARDIERVIQGSNVKVTNKGCCCMARIAHAGMMVDEVTDNIEAAVQTMVAKLRVKGPVVKLIHLKSQTSVALPIYTSELSHLALVEAAQRRPKSKRTAKKKDGKKSNNTIEGGEKVEDKKKVAQQKEKEEDEEIPQLVPIEPQGKKPKLEKPANKKTLKKAPKPAMVKKGKKSQGKQTKAAGRAEPKVKRKVPKKK